MIRKEKELFKFIFLILLSLSACVSTEILPPSKQPTTTLTTKAFSTSSPTFQITPSNISSSTPSPTLTPNSIAALTPIHSCITNLQGSKLNVLSDDVLYANVQGDQLDKALEENFPEWVTYTQTPDWSDEPLSAGEIIDYASFAERFQVNPAITLVTLGIELDWKLPANGDLFRLARETAKKLDLYFWEYAFDDVDEGTHIKDSYPEVENAATYAIYAFFDYDIEKLELWCETYVQLYNQSPLNPPES